MSLFTLNIRLSYLGYKLLAYVTLLSFIGLFPGCECEPDIYGDNLLLEVPVNTFPSIDTFEVGDTLWISANIDKNVLESNSSKPIYLEDFNFFTEFFIDEISDTVSNYGTNIQIIDSIGQMYILPLPTAVAYPIVYVELEDEYIFLGGIILHTPGLFFAGFSSSSGVLEKYDHPAVYKCKNNRRQNIDIYYSNQSTSLSAYEDLFLLTNIDHLKKINYQEYKDIGSHTFVVEPK